MIPPIARRFVAGETAAEAIERVAELDARGVGTLLNLLGEHYADREPAAGDTAEYRRLIDDVAEHDWRAAVSVKPSQIGLPIGQAVFEENAEEIVSRGAKQDVFVWFDMEGYELVEDTITGYEQLATAYPGRVGVCVQANLARTRRDLERLADVPGKIRLVKGAYTPPPGEGYRDKQQVNAVYADLLEFLFEEYVGAVAVGTHDRELIDRAIELHHATDGDFELQMLMGVRETLQFELAKDYDVWQYVPFGGKWLSYFYRRVMERKENAVFALRAILRR